MASHLKHIAVIQGHPDRRVIATMQMPAFVYRWYVHPHPEKNTQRLGGIRPIRESLIGLVEAPDPRKRQQWLVRVRTLGQRAL